MPDNRHNRFYAPPAWFTVLLVVLALPALIVPAFAPAIPADTPDASTMRDLVWIYPLYALTAAAMAWICYDSRRTTAWILTGLIILSHIAVGMTAHRIWGLI